MSNKSSLNYRIREIVEKDIESGGLLEVLENLAPGWRFSVNLL